MRGIYKISNNLNDKVYIGKSDNIFRRWNEHETMLRNNNHHSWKLQEFYNENDGKIEFDFKILEIVSDELELEDYEFKWEKEYNAIENGYNVALIKSDDKYKKPKESKVINKTPKKEDAILSYETGDYYLDFNKNISDLIKLIESNGIKMKIIGKIDLNLINQSMDMLDEIKTYFSIIKCEF
mgnify:CR=1 FL=1